MHPVSHFSGTVIKVPFSPKRAGEGTGKKAYSEIITVNKPVELVTPSYIVICDISSVSLFAPFFRRVYCGDELGTGNRTLGMCVFFVLDI